MRQGPGSHSGNHDSPMACAGVLGLVRRGPWSLSEVAFCFQALNNHFVRAGGAILCNYLPIVTFIFKLFEQARASHKTAGSGVRVIKLKGSAPSRQNLFSSFFLGPLLFIPFVVLGVVLPPLWLPKARPRTQRGLQKVAGIGNKNM